MTETKNSTGCVEAGCHGAVCRRSLCSRHYRQYLAARPAGTYRRIVGDDVRRFWSKVDRTEDGSCWLWTGGLVTAGYGHMEVRRGAGRAAVAAHRFAYEQIVGPIPAGLEIDHLCRVRRCVNPAHMEPVTKRVNILRGAGRGAIAARATHCAFGHPFSPENTYYRRNGNRRCRACELGRWRRRPAEAACKS